MTDLGLLMFNLDDNGGILRNAQDLSGIVDEIVVVDSSSPDIPDHLTRDLAPFGGRVVPVIPLGFGDSVRSFGVAQTRSDWVLCLDADERVSSPLRAALRSLRDQDAYVVPRFEIGLGSFTYHLRLFRRGSVQFRGRSYDFPSVNGRVGHLDRAHCILHEVEYSRYLGDRHRGERYFAVENVERPFLRAYLRDALTLRLGARGLKLPGVDWITTPADVALSGPMIRLVIEWEFLRDLLLGKGLPAAGFNHMYSVRKWRSLRDLPPERQQRILQIAQDVQHAGGLLEYLHLFNPSYLEKLTATNRWDQSGLDVLQKLLAYRHEHGQPMESFHDA